MKADFITNIISLVKDVVVNSSVNPTKITRYQIDLIKEANKDKRLNMLTATGCTITILTVGGMVACSVMDKIKSSKNLIDNTEEIIDVDEIED